MTGGVVDLVREGQDKILDIFNLINEAIFIHAADTGQILEANQYACEIFGYSLEESRKYTVGELSSGEPGFTQVEALVWMKKAQAGHPQRFDWQYRKKDGQIFWGEVNMRAAAIGGNEQLLAVVRDITERKQAEEILQQSADEFSVLSAVSIQVSKSLSVREVSSEALQGVLQATAASTAFLLLREGNDLIPTQILFSEPGRKFPELPTHKLGECLCGMAVSEGRPIFSVDLENDSRCTWDECKQVGMRSAATLPLFRGDEVFAVLGLGADSIRDFQSQRAFLETLASAISLGLQNAILYEEMEQHAANMQNEVKIQTRELEDSQKALLNMLEDVNEAKGQVEKVNLRLQELDRLKSMFIASMSHELRTPLNSIIGFTGILLQGLAGEINAEQQDQLRRVSRAGKHLLALITDVIDVSKIEAGKVTIHIKKCDLGELISEAVATMKPEADAKGLVLKSDIPAGITVETDGRRLLQCAINLLSNGVKYSERGEITITARQKADQVEISVADTGIGIREADLPLLFTSFMRLESHLKIKASGTGLGLYLTKKIITELLGGEVLVESKNGEGSIFSLKIPLQLSGKHES